MEEVAAKGNVYRGEAIYRRNELNCHAIVRVGPDMLSLGSSAQTDDGQVRSRRHRENLRAVRYHRGQS